MDGWRRPKESVSPLVEYPTIPCELARADWIEEDLRLHAIEMRYIPRENTFIEIWPHANGDPPTVAEGQLNETEVSDWLSRRDNLTMANLTGECDFSKRGGLLLLYGCGKSTNGRRDIPIPFNKATFNNITIGLSLPPNFIDLIDEETTRCFRTTLFNNGNEERGTVFIAKYFSWWLGSWSLGISYDYNSGVTSALLVGLENRVLRSSFIRLLKSKAELAGHPSLLPLLLCDTLAERHAREVHLSTNRILELETSIGVNDYTDGTPVAELDEADFTRISQSLNGELSRLANYEKWVNSHIVLLKEVLNGDGATGISTDSRWHSRSAQQTRKLEVMIKQYGNSLLGWNVDLLARIACQQKIVQGQIQTVYNLLAQRDNRLNIEIARASKRDSTAMKTIAILTMMFLPGAFIATLFSMNMFNWQAENGENVLSAYFWVYWVITVPITAIVLLIWMAWYRPWKA